MRLVRGGPGLSNQLIDNRPPKGGPLEEVIYLSVPKSKRKETPLTVLTDAQQLAAYTVLLCSDEKRFPKKYRLSFTSDIEKEAVNIVASTSKANAVFVNDEESYKLRRTYQQKAIAQVAGLQARMQVAYKLFPQLKTMGEADKKKRINIACWSGQLYKVKTGLLAWKKSDAERYKDLTGQ